jgi:prolyl-tRNA editing enzyme YbaK/EbsC (Cys-tRNA(Pro) deacylase)
VSFQIFQHLTKITSLQQAAAERGQDPDQIIRSIVFRLPKERFLMVLMPGERQISWKALRNTLGERRISLASPQEVIQQTGYEIGAVTPFGLPHPMLILADPLVFSYPEISLGSGRRGYALIVPSTVLKELFPDIRNISLTG